MSGLVPMHEYRRVVEERDALKDEVAYLRSETGEDMSAARVSAVRVALGVPVRVARLLLCLAGAPTHAAVRFCKLEESGPYTLGSAKVQMHRLRVRLAALGAPDAIETIWGMGYRLTPEARAWLRQHVPDAFPATKEPSR